MTIFVHGSVGSTFWLLDPKNVWNDTLKPNSPYIRTVQTFRDDPRIARNQILGDCGFHQWSPQGISPERDEHQASTILIPAFDTVAKFIGGHAEQRVYYTFGHLGLLSQTYRAQAAAELYHALVAEYNRLKESYKEVIIDAVSHSHGGNIVLMLARCEATHNKGLRINDCIMLGTPIQTETAACAYASFFKRVINIYSDGDSIQGIDKMSTSSRVSYKTFDNKHLTIARLPQGNVYDVRVRVNKYTKKVGHANLWLMGMKQPVCRRLDPLPAFILVPCLIDLLNNRPDEHHIDWVIWSRFNSLYCYMTSHGQHRIHARTPEMGTLIKGLVSQTNQLLPSSFSNHIPIFNMLDMRAIYSAFCSLWQPNMHPHAVSDLVPYSYI